MLTEHTAATIRIFTAGVVEARARGSYIHSSHQKSVAFGPQVIRFRPSEMLLRYLRAFWAHVDAAQRVDGQSTHTDLPSQESSRITG